MVDNKPSESLGLAVTGRRATARLRAVGLPVVPAIRGGIVTRRALFARLGEAARVTQISAPAGSGKTFLLRSWIGEAGLAADTAWVPVQSQEGDAQRFWISVADALRGTSAGSKLVRELTAAPDLDGWAIVERLLNDLAALEDRLWLVIDDLHELVSAEAQRQLQLLVMRAPPGLRFVLSTRRDLRLRLHRLRLEGNLVEIRAADLRFSLEEARALFHGAGVELSESALAQLHERTEGWAAGLRLAALSLAGHPDPDAFAAGFYGSERTVADYLLAEVLERQSEEVQRLLLRTSMLERVNGELAGLMTGCPDAERTLQDLEQAGAFVVSLDGRRTCRGWRLSTSASRYSATVRSLPENSATNPSGSGCPASDSAASRSPAAHPSVRSCSAASPGPGTTAGVPRSASAGRWFDCPQD